MPSSANYNRLVGQYNMLTTDMDFMGVGTLALAGGGGAMLAEEVADRLGNYIGSIDGSSGADAQSTALAGLSMLGFAVMLGYGGSQVTGYARHAVGGLGLGAMVAGGVTLIDAAQRSGIFGSIPGMGGSAPTRSVSASRSSGSAKTVKRSSSSSTASRSSPTVSQTRRDDFDRYRGNAKSAASAGHSGGDYR